VTSGLTDERGKGNLVGPVLLSGEFVQVVADAIELDNPDRKLVVSDHLSYVRVHTPHECMIRRGTVEQVLGRWSFDVAAAASQRIER
jgi:MmoB/DmpM family protein